jgi:hypothetical protein
MGDGINVSGELALRLRAADGAELVRLLAERREELDLAAVRQALLNPFASTAAIELMLGEPRLLGVYEIRRSLAGHPRTPLTAALELTASLFWRDHAELAADARVAPQVRRAAERYLVERLSGLGEGERVSLARLATGTVLSRLRNEGSPRVIGAMLENPRLTEGVLAPLLASDGTSAEVLATVAASRWGMRHEVRLALVRNRQTPLPLSLSLLTHLRSQDLRAVAKDPRLGAALRQAAARRLGQA